MSVSSFFVHLSKISAFPLQASLIKRKLLNLILLFLVPSILWINKFFITSEHRFFPSFLLKFRSPWLGCQIIHIPGTFPIKWLIIYLVYFKNAFLISLDPSFHGNTTFTKDIYLQLALIIIVQQRKNVPSNYSKTLVAKTPCSTLDSRGNLLLWIYFPLANSAMNAPSMPENMCNHENEIWDTGKFISNQNHYFCIIISLLSTVSQVYVEKLFADIYR